MGFELFPNPSNENIILKGLRNEQVVRIVNLQGNILWNTVSNSGDLLFPISSLSPGVYLIYVGDLTKKFIKL